MEEEDRIDGVLISARKVNAAAKVHFSCAACGFPIMVGEPYVRRVGLIDGEFYTQRIHDRPCSEEWTYDV